MSYQSNLMIEQELDELADYLGESARRELYGGDE